MRYTFLDPIFIRLSAISKDKLSHSFYGSLFFAIVALFNIEVAMISTFVLAFAKEIYDEWKYGGFDVVDLLFTILIPVIIYIGVAL